MPGISRVGVDAAGGVIVGALQNFVRVEGSLWAVLGDAVAGHGIGVHAGPVMGQGSSFIRINGIQVCRAGHAATCGHAATGSAAIRISD